MGQADEDERRGTRFFPGQANVSSRALAPLAVAVKKLQPSSRSPPRFSSPVVPRGAAHAGATMRRLASRLSLLLDAHPPDAVARASCRRVASAASASSSGRPPLDVDRSVVARAGWSFRGPVRGASAAAAAAPSVAAAPSPAGPPAASAFDASSPRMSPSRLRRLRVENLRELAAARGLDVAGRKVDLVSRLLLSFDGDDAEDRRAGFGAADPLPAPVPPRSPPSEDEVGALLDRPQGSSSPAGAPPRRLSRPPLRVLGPEEHGISPEDIPPFVHALRAKLAASDGRRLLVVGGAVRDLILGRKPRDFDLLTDATWTQIKRRASPAQIIGRRFKVAHVWPERNHRGGGGEKHARGGRGANAEVYELVAMEERERHERTSGPASGPASLSTNASWEDAAWLDRLRADASSRDFSVNALMYDVGSGVVYDFVGGVEDAKASVVRAVADSPVGAFREDPARVLRAVRVAARHDMRLASDVRRALSACASEIRDVSPARVLGELKTMLSCGAAAKAVRLMYELGVLEHVMHAHATLIAKAVDPKTTFVAKPTIRKKQQKDHAPDSTEHRENENEPEEEGRDERSLSEGDDDFSSKGTRRFAPWEDRSARGEDRSARRRAAKRVSAARLDEVVRTDPVFACLRALDAIATPTRPASEAMVFAALAAPFAVKKRGWPPARAEEDSLADDDRGGRRASSSSGASRRAFGAKHAAWTAEAARAAIMMSREYVGGRDAALASSVLTLHAPTLDSPALEAVARRSAALASRRDRLARTPRLAPRVTDRAVTLSFKEAADVSNKVVAEALRELAPKRARNRGVAVKPGEVRAFARILRDARAMTDEDDPDEPL